MGKNPSLYNLNGTDIFTVTTSGGKIVLYADSNEQIVLIR